MPKVLPLLSKAGFRVKADIDTDRMNAKIRKYQEQKIPYQLVVGEKEKQNNSVTVRLLKGAQKTMSVDEFTAFLKLKTDTVATRRGILTERYSDEASLNAIPEFFSDALEMFDLFDNEVIEQV